MKSVCIVNFTSVAVAEDGSSQVLNLSEFEESLILSNYLHTSYDGIGIYRPWQYICEILSFELKKTKIVFFFIKETNVNQ